MAFMALFAERERLRLKMKFCVFERGFFFFLERKRALGMKVYKGDFKITQCGRRRKRRRRRTFYSK